MTIQVPYLKDPSLSFRAKLLGVTNVSGYPWPLESPYTGNKLPVYLHRETETLPPKAQILHAIRSLNGGDDTTTDIPNSIDFMHLRKEHLPQLNRLLSDAFWPNIDVTESLEYPDYSVVLLYGRLIIGCGLVSPEGYLTYLYVHPDWRSNGLASRLLHLLATRLLPDSRDITAHVAVGNPAILLYQRFAFKPEEFIVDFYAGKFIKTEDADKLDPTMRNAFFMRLKR
jgi:ribosomal protein S18 acetylase RimI-like enzyme